MERRIIFKDGVEQEEKKSIIFPFSLSQCRLEFFIFANFVGPGLFAPIVIEFFPSGMVGGDRVSLKRTLLNGVGGTVGWSLAWTSILSVSNWWIVRFCTCCGFAVAPLIVFIFAPLMLLIVVLVSVVICVVNNSANVASVMRFSTTKFIHSPEFSPCRVNWFTN